MITNDDFRDVHDVHNFYEDLVLSGELPIHLASPLVQRIYWWGYWAGHESRASEITQALHERDVYYRVACRGGFGTSRTRNLGPTYSELELIRKGVN